MATYVQLTEAVTGAFLLRDKLGHAHFWGDRPCEGREFFIEDDRVSEFTERGIIGEKTVAEPEVPLPENDGMASTVDGVSVKSQSHPSFQEGVDWEVEVDVDYGSAAPCDSTSNQPPSAAGKIGYWTPILLERPTEEVTKLICKVDSEEFGGEEKLDALENGKQGLRIWYNALRATDGLGSKATVKWLKESGDVVSTVEYSISFNGLKFAKTKVTPTKLTLTETKLTLTVDAPLPARLKLAVTVTPTDGPAIDATVTGDGIASEFELSSSAIAGQTYSLTSISGEYAETSVPEGGLNSVAGVIRSEKRRVTKKSS